MNTPKQQSFFILILISLLISGCSDSGKLTPLGKYDVILAFGDSLTEGVGAPRNQSYPAVLEERLGRGVINAGISGETTSEGLARFKQTIDDYAPSLVILLEGGNDILNNHPAAKIQKNLAEMIEIAHQNNIQVLLISVPEKRLFSDTAPFYLELAEHYRIPLEETIISELLRSPQYKSDPIHFNAKGYQKLAEAIHRRLISEGAIAK